MQTIADGPTIYENAVPAFVGAELERLYENIYCTLGRWKIYGEDIGASTYVSRRDGCITAVILFHQLGSCLQVLNQQVSIPQNELQMFLSEIFGRYGNVKKVRFYAMETVLGDIGYSTTAFPSVEENIIYLPATPEEFIASLSPSTQKNLLTSQRRLVRDHPTFEYSIHAGADVGDEVLHEIFSLCDQRMDVKHKSHYIDRHAAESIIRLARLHGYVGLTKIDGRLGSGNIWYKAGGRYFMHILAHDPRYDGYKLGNLQSYWSLCDCIAHGGRECWMMGGGREHKSRFTAKTKHLYSTIVFRTKLTRLIDVRATMTAAFIRWRHAAKERLFLERAAMAARDRQNKGVGFTTRFVRSLSTLRGQSK